MNLPYSLLSVRYQQKPHDETYTKRPGTEILYRSPAVLENAQRSTEPTFAFSLWRADKTSLLPAQIKNIGQGDLKI